MVWMVWAGASGDVSISDLNKNINLAASRNYYSLTLHTFALWGFRLAAFCLCPVVWFRSAIVLTTICQHWPFRRKNIHAFNCFWADSCFFSCKNLWFLINIQWICALRPKMWVMPRMPHGSVIFPSSHFFFYFFHWIWIKVLSVHSGTMPPKDIYV